MSLRIVLLMIYIFIKSTSIHAQELDFKVNEWRSFDLDKITVVATKNAADDTLSAACSPEKLLCYYSLRIFPTCVDGFKTFAIASTDQGAEPLSLECTSNGYLLSPYETINRLILNSNNIAFAVPLEGGRFSVSRFTLVGAVAQLRLMGAKMNKAFEASKNKMHEIIPNEIQ
ncbi:MAG: hypothetical protein V4650_08460 [Pseudomonadota bacterium]